MRQKSQWIVMLVALAVAAGAGWAQETAPQPPNTAPGAPVQTVNAGSTAPSAPQVQPDTHPLAGGYLFSLGSALEEHSYFQPEFSIFEGVQTNAHEFVQGAGSGTLAATIPTVSLSLTHISRISSLNVAYLGGGIIYDNSPSFSSSYHLMNFSDAVQFRRWGFSLGDMFTYLPTSSYGFGGMGIPGGIGSGFESGFGFASGVGQINPAFSATSSILTSQFGAFSNTAIAEAGYSASARTSFTMTGVYGILQAGKRGEGFINTNQVYGIVGVNRALSARDTLSVNYTYGQFGYVGLPESFNVQMVELAYGRKLTGRLSLQAYGGPELLRYTTTGIGSRSSIYGTGTAALNYNRGRNTFSLYAGRYASAGSGVVAGAVTTMLDLGWTRQVTRKWSASVYGGYDRNTRLLSSAALSNSHFSYWFGNVMLTHSISRAASLFISYEYQRQASNTGACTLEICAGSLARQVFGVGLTFSPRPRAL